MTYNLTRDYPDLNSPDHIFQEWQCLSGKVAPVQKNQSFSKISSDNQLEDAKIQFSCEFNLLNGMVNSKDPTSLYPSLISLNDQIFDFVFEFNNIQSIKGVKEIVNQPGQSSAQARNLVSKIKSTAEKVLLTLSLLKNHTEFLANPKLPEPNYWHIISNIMRDLYNILMQFIKNIQQFSTSFIPVEKLVMSANPDLSSSSLDLFSPTQSQSQFSSLGNNGASTTIYYPTLHPIEFNQIPLNNRGKQRSKRSKYNEPIERILQLTKKLQQIKNPKENDFTNVVTTLCELNNLNSTFTDMYSKVRSMSPDIVSNLAHLNISDLEAMYDKKEKLEKKITNSAQRESSKEFSKHIGEYYSVVEQLLDAFKKCL